MTHQQSAQPTYRGQQAQELFAQQPATQSYQQRSNANTSTTSRRMGRILMQLRPYQEEARSVQHEWEEDGKRLFLS